jgi:FixJ family two-component response regulator
MEEKMRASADSSEPKKSHINKQDVGADRALVLIVDDDERVRLAIQELIHSVGLDATCFASTQQLLDSALDERPGCLILDVRLPGLSGLDFQQHLNGNPFTFLLPRSSSG